MTVSCILCKEIITTSPVIMKAPLPGYIDLDTSLHDALAYQQAIQAFMQHVGQRHPEFITTLAGTANTYHMHLVAKLAISSDPKFEEQRQAARALCYWTLKGDFQTSAPVPKVDLV